MRSRLHATLVAFVALVAAARGDVAAGSRFRQVQRSLARRPASIRAGARTRIVLPSSSVDARELAKLTGARFYEERQLHELLALRDPDLRVMFLSSTAIDPAIVSYVLGLLPRSVRAGARSRLSMISTGDPSDAPLTEKVLERPELLAAIRQDVERDQAHIHPFITSPLERRLARRLRIPLLGTDPARARGGTKSGAQERFDAAGVPRPDGYGDIHGSEQLVDRLSLLVEHHPGLRRAVVKLNDGFSGEGNAILDLRGMPELSSLAPAARRARLRAALPHLEFTAASETWPSFEQRIGEIGGVAEVFVEGRGKRSPSVQGLIHPDGHVEIVSTHEQILGGRDNQVYIGSRFPADAAYRDQLTDIGLRVGRLLAAEGAMGRFAVDTVAVRRPGATWDLYALEINLRQGGTTHPYETTRQLTGATYDQASGLLLAPGPRGGSPRPRSYASTDSVKLPGFIGHTPAEFLAAARGAGLAYDARSQTGPVFHMIGALGEYGKVGFTAIGGSPEEADAIYRHTRAVLRRLDREIRRR